MKTPAWFYVFMIVFDLVTLSCIGIWCKTIWMLKEGPDPVQIWGAVVLSLLPFAVPAAGGVAMALSGGSHSQPGDLTGEDLAVMISPVGAAALAVVLAGIAFLGALLFALMQPSTTVELAVFGCAVIFALSMAALIVTVMRHK